MRQAVMQNIKHKRRAVEIVGEQTALLSVQFIFQSRGSCVLMQAGRQLVMLLVTSTLGLRPDQVLVLEPVSAQYGCVFIKRREKL